MEETTPKALPTLHADLKALHRQLEELGARVQAERALGKRAKTTGEPAAFSAGK